MKISSLSAGGASLRPLVTGAGISLVLCALSQAATVTNPGFTTGTGTITSLTSLLSATASANPQALGSSGWYGASYATNAALNAAGFRGGVEVNSVNFPGVGRLSYGLGAGVGGLLGLDLPETNLWQPLTGQTLLANTTYQLSMEVDAASLLDVSALSARGFGIGVTSLSSTTSIGTFIAESASNPSLLSISVLGGGTNQRLTLQFTTGGTAVTDPGIVVFGGRGTQGITASLLTSYSVDNVTLNVVPEPSATLLFGGAACALLARRRR